jgi:hypothetical protein
MIVEIGIVTTIELHYLTMGHLEDFNGVVQSQILKQERFTGRFEKIFLLYSPRIAPPRSELITHIVMRLQPKQFFEELRSRFDHRISRTGSAIQIEKMATFPSCKV